MEFQDNPRVLQDKQEETPNPVPETIGIQVLSDTTKKLVDKIRKVDEFNPNELVTQYGDLNNGTKTLVFKNRALVIWIRLYWPNCCLIQKSERHESNIAKGIAEIYMNPSDTNPIARAEVYRSKTQYLNFMNRQNPEMPLVENTTGHYEWAMTYALSKAIMLAGFGLTADFIEELPEYIKDQAEEPIEADVEQIIEKINELDETDVEQEVAVVAQQDDVAIDSNIQSECNDTSTPPEDNEQATSELPSISDVAAEKDEVQVASSNNKIKRMTEKRAREMVFKSEKYPDGIKLGELFLQNPHFVHWLSKDKENCHGDGDIYRAVICLVKNAEQREQEETVLDIAE